LNVQGVDLAAFFKDREKSAALAAEAGSDDDDDAA
jgi:hypothetical protein